MKPVPRGKKAWDLTSESFARLLAALDSDQQRAAERYEQLRRKLVNFFEWRGSATADELADETLNRLARKIDEGEPIRNLSSYLGGMARLVWLESLKEQERQRGAFEDLSISSQHPAKTDLQRIECFEFCLQSLPPENHVLILDYYRDEKSARIALRKRLAEKLGTPLNALRIRAHRIRIQLEQCVGECVGKVE
jgi:DNA-directed RNA polymerase specialized sigma24 family protein